MNKQIIIEHNAWDTLKELLKNFEKVLVVSSEDIYTLFKKEIEQKVVFENCDLYFVQDYRVEEALTLSKHLIVNYYECLVSIGGGTVNDTCKLAAKYSEKKLISIPTIISNDGVCSNTSVLKFDGERTDGLPSKSPDVVVIDIDLIKNSPKKYLKAGICDILSNYTALYDWDLAIKRGKEKTDDVAKMISSNSFWSLFNLPETIDEDLKIKITCESIVLSGVAMELKGNTRPCSGSEHLFNHAIVAHYPQIQVLHGYLVGLGALVSSILQNQNFNKLVRFLKDNEIDVRPSALGISKEIFIDAWLKARFTRPNRYTILNEIELTREKIEAIYKQIEEAY